eukprot:761408-Hanusia_phi.AAC.4
MFNPLPSRRPGGGWGEGGGEGGGESSGEEIEDAYAQRKSSWRREHSDVSDDNYSVASFRSQRNVFMPTDDIILSGTLFKKIVSSSISWQPRLAVLTSSTLSFASPSNPSVVLDDIPLHEIHDVGFGSELDDMIDAAEGSKRRSSRRPTKTRKSASALNTDLVFYVQTSEDGKNSGRTFIFQARDENELNEWFSNITNASKDAKRERKQQSEKSKIGNSNRKWLQVNCLKLYKNRIYRAICSTIILFAVAMTLYQTEVYYTTATSSSRLLSDSAVKVFNVGCSLFFLVELFVMIVGHIPRWKQKFIIQAWNSVDILVILISVIAATFEVKVTRSNLSSADH